MSAHIEPAPATTGYADRAGSLVLVAVDNSPAALRAAAYAVGLARRQAALLLFIHVRTHPVTYGLFPQALPDCPELLAAASAHLRSELHDLLDDCGISWELREVEGDPLTELRRIEAATGADVVVVGASRRRRRRSGLGVGLLARGRCPVLVVP